MKNATRSSACRCRNVFTASTTGPASTTSSSLKIWCRRYETFLGSVTFGWTDIWSNQHLVKLTFGWTNIWSNWHLVELTFGRTDIWLNWHLVILTFGRTDIWLNEGKLKTFGGTKIWSNWHLVKPTFGWTDIWSNWHLVELTFGQTRAMLMTLDRTRSHICPKPSVSHGQMF